MQPSPQIDVYKEVLTAIVQRFMRLMGEPALRFARRVYGLHIEDDGTVTRYQGDGLIIVQGLVIEYMTLLGREALPLSQRAINSTVQQNPSVKLPSLLN
jgi:class 3 adenylate cyclase